MNKATKGSITPWCALSLFLVIAMILTLTEAARTRAAFTFVRYAMTSSTDLLLGNYCRELADTYCIYAFDGSYGTTSLVPDQMAEEWSMYMGYYADQSGLFSFELESASVNTYKTMIDNDGTLFLNSVCAYMKYQEVFYGIEWFQKALDIFKSQAQASDEAEGELNTVRNAETDGNKSIEPMRRSESLTRKTDDADATESSDETDDADEAEDSDDLSIEDQINRLAEEIKKIDITNLKISLGILNEIPFLCDPNLFQMSNESISVENLPSTLTKQTFTDVVKELMENLSEGTLVEYLSDIGEISVEKAMLIQYINDHCTSYSSDQADKETEGQLDFELEYLLGGAPCDRENIRNISIAILFFRLVANVAYLLNCEEKMEEVETLSKATFGLIGGEIGAQIGKYAYMVLWAEVESVAELKSLLNGKKLHLIKTDSDWKTDLSGLTTMAAEGGTEGILGKLQSLLQGTSGGTSIGTESTDLAEVTETGETTELAYNPEFSYRDCILFMLFFMDTESLCYRMMDVIQLHMVQTYPNFRMSNMIYAVDMQCEIICQPVLVPGKDEDWLLLQYAQLGTGQTFHDYQAY